MEKSLHFTQDSKGIGRLIFDVPGEKVNVFSIDIMKELGVLIDEIAAKKDLKALVISSAKNNNFVAGADIKGFLDFKGETQEIENMIRLGQGVFRKIETLPFPSIAVIEGSCLGGGLEFALSCTYRIVVDQEKTAIGLPEVSIGLVPAWGGITRLPNLVGLEQSLGMIASGRPINAKKAWKIKLADAITSSEFQEESLDKFLGLCLTSKGKKKIEKQRNNRGIRGTVLESCGQSLVFSQAKKSVLSKTKGLYPAPISAIDAIKESYKKPLQEGFNAECRAFVSLMKMSIPKNLIRLFFTSNLLKKDKGVKEKVTPITVKNVAVMGSGIMGSGIAWLFSKNGIPVRLKDISWEVIGKGMGAIRKMYAFPLKVRKMTPGQVNLKMHSVTGTVDYTGFNKNELIIEAISENLSLKKQVFSEVEKVVSPETIICSNTSTLSISVMNKDMKHPERLVGVHFFNPVNRMPLVEVIPSDVTSSQAVVTAMALLKKLGKTPILVKDCPGFLVNRILTPYLVEATWLFEEGGDVEEIDKVFTKFGMPMGPFTLFDEVGIDVAYKVATLLEGAYGERMKAASIAKNVYDKKFFGKKTGAGFYIHKGKKPVLNQAAVSLRKASSTSNFKLKDKEILERVLFSMVNEAARCLEEKVVETPAYVDMATVMGTGFPPFHGGVLKYADEIGVDYITDRLKEFTSKYGPRFTPCNLLFEKGEKRQLFYSADDKVEG